jgi:N utilization substance protein A
VKGELFDAIREIEKEKGIPASVLLESIEVALATAYKKEFGQNQNVRVEIANENGNITVYTQRTVVEEVFDDQNEISLEEAKELSHLYQIDDVVEKDVTPKEFGRMAALVAKQVVVQRIREAERNIVYDTFVNRESELLNGIIQRNSKGIIFVDLGKTEAQLLPTEQIAHEDYTQGRRLKVYVTEVKKTPKGPQVLVSRTHPGLVRRLFELEVPEIHDGMVEIKSISREAGSRTKIAVHANNTDIDPVGSCVGQKGIRVQNIVDELGGEKIDIIEWSSSPVIYITNALSPSKVEQVIVNENDKTAVVVVPDYQLSLAIGKEGQNARLAAKLTGWKVDIKSSSQYKSL